MRQKTGSVDLAALLALANGKTNSYYLPSTTPPTSPAEGDQWFQPDKGNEFFRYTNGAWEKIGLTSAIFSNVTAGGATIGFLNSLLVYADADNYWNMSGADLDSDLEPASTPGDTTFAAKTLKTSHLVALEDVHVDGGPGSYLKIPTEADEQSYVELDNGGMTIKSRKINTDNNAEFEITTIYPSSTENDGVISSSTMEETRSPSPGDPVEWRDYRTTYAVEGLYLSYAHGTGSGSGKTTTKKYSYSFLYDELTAKEDDVTYLWLNHTALTLGSVIHPMDFYLNNVNIAPIAEQYPSATGHVGACAVRVEAGMCKYMSFGVNASNNTLYVYGGNSADSLSYIGRVQLT